MKTFGKIILIVLFAFMLNTPSQAKSFFLSGPAQKRVSPFGHVWNYITTHKELLTGDAIVTSAWSADAASTVYDIHHCVCVETNPLLGPHPSEHAVWMYGIGGAALQATISHLIWHYAPDHEDRHLFWFFVAPIAVEETINVRSNVQAARIAPKPSAFYNVNTFHFVRTDPFQTALLGTKERFRLPSTAAGELPARVILSGRYSSVQ